MCLSYHLSCWQCIGADIVEKYHFHRNEKIRTYEKIFKKRRDVLIVFRSKSIIEYMKRSLSLKKPFDAIIY